MKLIIDIPEKIEEYIKDYIPIGAGNNVFCYPDEIVRIMQNGTPIPDNATNGDIIKAMFPQFKLKYVSRDKITNMPQHVMYYEEMVWTSFPTEWWNAPYQKGGKE